MPKISCDDEKREVILTIARHNEISDRLKALWEHVLGQFPTEKMATEDRAMIFCVLMDSREELTQDLKNIYYIALRFIMLDSAYLTRQACVDALEEVSE